MAPGDKKIDEFSMLLGDLKRGQDIILDQNGKLFRMADGIKKDVAETKGDVKGLYAKDAARKIDIQDNKDDIKSLTAHKNKSLGIMAGIGIGGGTMGAFAKSIWEFFTK